MKKTRVSYSTAGTALKRATSIPARLWIPLRKGGCCNTGFPGDDMFTDKGDEETAQHHEECYK